MRAFINTFHDFRRSWDSAVLLSLPAFLGVLLTMLFSNYIYTALGSIFLRASDIALLSPFEFLIALVVVIIAVSLLSFTVIAISILVKEGRTNIDFTSNKVIRRIIKHLPQLAFLYLLLFVLGFLMQLLSLYTHFLLGFHILLFLVFGFVFAMPYAIAIDDYKFAVAFIKSFSMFMKNPANYFAWVIFNFVAIILISNLSFIILSYETGSYVAYALISLLVLPFSIILAAHLYMDKYPLS
ncbi:MAG: hypothetical protein QXI89_00025 [Candidatus Anstonellales archaeon]